MPYAFDPTGLMPANKILNEAHTVTWAGETTPYVILPMDAPFYGESLSIVDENSNTLVEGADYYLILHYQDATDNVGKDIYGGIAFINVSASGQFKLNYQTLGGNYALGADHGVIEGFQALTLVQLQMLDWSSSPASFPPTPHNHPLAELTGMQQIYDLLFAIKEATESPEAQFTMDDIVDLDTGFISPLMAQLSAIQSAIPSVMGLFAPVTDLQTKMAALYPYASVNPTINNWSIPLGGFFIIKVGRVVYDPTLTPGDPGGQPIALTWPGAFPNKCLYADSRVTFEDANAVIKKDKSFLSTPTTAGVNFVDVEYEDVSPTGNRVLWYFAVGI